MDRSKDSDKDPLERVLDSGEPPSASTSKPSRRSKSTPLGEQKCCLGLTYFSQAMHEKGSMPVRRLVQNCCSYVRRKCCSVQASTVADRLLFALSFARGCAKSPAFHQQTGCQI